MQRDINFWQLFCICTNSVCYDSKYSAKNGYTDNLNFSIRFALYRPICHSSDHNHFINSYRECNVTVKIADMFQYFIEPKLGVGFKMPNYYCTFCPDLCPRKDQVKRTQQHRPTGTNSTAESKISAQLPSSQEGNFVYI